MKGLYWQLSILVLLTAFLSVAGGCTDYPSLPPPNVVEIFSCQRLLYSFSDDLRFGEDSPEEVASILVNSLGDQLDLHTVALVGDLATLEWSFQGDRFSALFRNNRLTQIQVRWIDRQPTLAEVVGCVGYPEQYHAIYKQFEVRELDVSLWYLERGLVVGGYSFHSSQLQLPEVSSDYKMTSFTIVSPGTPEQMTMDVYTDGDSPGVQAYALRLLKPWPGSLKEIRVDSCLATPDLCKTDIP